MNKYVFLLVVFLFVIFITLVSNQIESYNAQDVSSEITNDIELNSTGIMDLLSTYWNLITFKVEGLPFILNLLIFHPINGVMVYLVLEILKDVIPFT